MQLANKDFLYQFSLDGSYFRSAAKSKAPKDVWRPRRLIPIVRYPRMYTKQTRAPEGRPCHSAQSVAGSPPAKNDGYLLRTWRPLTASPVTTASVATPETVELMTLM